jgi:thymidylate synthase
MTLDIKGYSIAEVWIDCLEQIWNHGSLVEIMYDGKSIETVELIGLRSEIKKPGNKDLLGNYIWKSDSEAWEIYKKEFFDKATKGFAYTYGSRLRDWGMGYLFPSREVDLKPISIDQIEYIIKELKRDPSSRRAVAITWVPSVDEETETPPCLMNFHCFIRNNILRAICNYRSHDIAGAYPANSYGLNGVLEYIGEKLKCQTGSITFFSESAHIYQHDWPMVASILGTKIQIPIAKQRDDQAKALDAWRRRNHSNE